MSTYEVGQVLTVSITIKDSTGTLADPGTGPTCLVTLPDGSTASATVTKTSTGTYQATYTSTQAGLHLFTWSATGANSGGFPYTEAEDVFSSPPILTLDEMKDHLGIVGSAEDNKLQEFVDTAIGIIEDIAGPIKSRSITEIHDAGSPTIFLNQCPVISVTSITEVVRATTYTLTNQPVGSASSQYGYTIDSARYGKITRRGAVSQPVPFGLTGDRRIGTVTVVYTAGSPYPAAKVRMAVKELTRYMWRQVTGAQSSFQDGQFVSQAASSGVSEAMIQRVKMILGVGGTALPGIA